MIYKFGVLWTHNTDAARAHNAELLGRESLGIEVNIPYLSKECGLGNIDPQHKVNGGSSAIEQAMLFPVPPSGAKLVTTRRDKDSVGAMAVLELRAAGRQYDIDWILVARIGAMDRAGYTIHTATEIENAAFVPRKVTDALNAIIHRLDLWPTIETAVAQFMRMLTSQIPASEIEWMMNQREPKRNPASYAVENCSHSEGRSDIGFVEAPGDYHRARDWANSRFHVGVVFDPIHETEQGGRYPRYTLVRQKNYFDRRAFEDEANQMEAAARSITVDELRATNPSWGGPNNIVNSPQGEGNETKLSKETIIKLVQKHFYSGIVS